MKKFLTMMAAALGALLAGAAEELPTRLDVASVPSGARVYVDGKLSGTTPCQLFEVKPGTRLVRLEKASRAPHEEFVKIGKGQFVQMAATLKEEKALILVKTEPPGAEVKHNGASLGETPLLITTLASGETHALELSLNGYQRRRIDVKAEGREPLVREESLYLDSGTVTCNSTPAGATVTINGVERGVTPLTVQNLPKGLATVTMKLAGYAEETRELRLLAGDRQTLSLKLKGNPAALKVVSVPEGARVWVDGDYQGKTPVEVKATPGEHELKVELEGHAAAVRTVRLENGAAKTENFVLDSTLGTLEVVTAPAGVRVTVDGRSVGTTEADGDGGRSKVLTVRGVAVGTRAVALTLDGHKTELRQVEFKPQETKQLTVRLTRVFTADTEVETINGSAPVRGVLISNDARGITLEVRPGVQRTIPHGEIRKKRSLKR